MPAHADTTRRFDRSFEALERRTLLSSNFWSVGVMADPSTGSVNAFWEDGALSASGQVTATRHEDDATGGGTVVPSDWSGVRFDDDGGLHVQHSDDRFEQLLEQGASFDHRRGFPLGWFIGVGNPHNPSQLFWTLERPTDLTLDDLQGTWAFNGVNIERRLILPPELDTLFGSIKIDASAAAGDFNERTGGSLVDTPFSGSVASVDPNGAVRFSGDDLRNIIAFVGKDKTVAVWGDFRSDDNGVALGAAVKRGADFTADQAAGVFRVLLVLPDQMNGMHLTPSMAVMDLRIELKADGTFTALDLSDFDKGINTVRSQGTWTIDGDEITATNADGIKSTWVISSNGASLLPTSLTETDGTVRPLGGLGARVRTQGTDDSPIVTIIHDDDDGHHTIFERGADGVWRRADLQALAGGPAIIGRAEAWRGLNGTIYAAAVTAEGLGLYTHHTDGTWTFTNLTTTISGAQPIVGRIAVFVDTGGAAGIAGLNADGQLVLYRQHADDTWTFTNLTEQFITASGGTMPHLVGDVTAWVTPWNGLNLGALDDQGNVKAVWTAPALNGMWVLSDLSEETDAPAMHGSLSVFVAPWGGVNITGLDQNGQALVTWWAPGQERWQKDNLTANAGGMAFASGSTTSYVNPWGGLNVAGIDSDGDVQILWWAPGMDHWRASKMTTSADTTMRPVGEVQAVTAPDGRSTVYGTNAQGHVIARTFEPSEMRWTTTDLTETAAEM